MSQGENRAPSLTFRWGPARASAPPSEVNSLSFASFPPFTAIRRRRLANHLIEPRPGLSRLARTAQTTTVSVVLGNVNARPS